MTLPVAWRPSTVANLPLAVTLALDGWIAGGTDSYGTEWWVTDLGGWHGSPPVRLSGVDRPGDHGQFDGPTYWGARVITASGYAIAPDQPTALLANDIVSSLCSDASQLYTLQVTEAGRSTRRALVRLNTDTKVGLTGDRSLKWDLSLRAPDPRRYDDTLTSVAFYPPSGSTTGFSIPFTVPVVIPAVTTGTSGGTLTNAGTIATRPTVTLNGPLVNPSIANVSQGRTLSFVITLVAGDQLVVDFDRRSVTLNGSASRASTLDSGSAWWDLTPGGNDVMFTAGGGSGSAVVAYRSAWL